jgi:hypothetical protein
MAFPAALHAQRTITGQAAFAGYSEQKRGVRRKIIVAALLVSQQEAMELST